MILVRIHSLTSDLTSSFTHSRFRSELFELNSPKSEEKDRTVQTNDQVVLNEPSHQQQICPIILSSQATDIQRIRPVPLEGCISTGRIVGIWDLKM